VIVSVLLVAAALLFPAGLPAGFEEDPGELLARAEAHVRQERYTDALAIYRRLATKFAETPEGRIAARRTLPSAFLGWTDLVRHGPSSNRVDVVLMGEGYTLQHQKAFDDLAEDIPRLFERQRTFREYWSYFNFLRANLVSADDGVDGFGREYDTALDARTLKTFSGHVGVDRAKVREVLAELPEQDGQAIVFVKQGVLGTGGNGVAVIGGMSARTTIHEFGHSFGGLSDEYAERQAHTQGAVRDGINVAASDDPRKVPWAHWLQAKHPSIGVYEGAAARVRGAWKPTASGCIMESGEFFCPVCQEALVLRIYSLVDPIDACAPRPPPPGIREPVVLRDEPIELTVTVLKPASHDLQVDWWVLSESRVPETGDGRDRGGPGRGRTDVARAAKERDPAEGRFGDRRDRGKLQPISDRPWSTNRADADGVHTLRLRRSDLDPGTYKVVCRAKDTTRLRDDKWPWVVKDEYGLLESERVWWVRVPTRGS
jgi:hypothetical protein